MSKFIWRVTKTVWIWFSAWGYRTLAEAWEEAE